MQSPNRDPNGTRPLAKPKTGNAKRMGIAAIVVLAAVAAGLWFMRPPAEEKAPGPAKPPAEEAAALKIKNQPIQATRVRAFTGASSRGRNPPARAS